MNCKEMYEDEIDYRSYTHNLSCCDYECRSGLHFKIVCVHK